MKKSRSGFTLTPVIIACMGSSGMAFGAKGGIPGKPGDEPDICIVKEALACIDVPDATYLDMPGWDLVFEDNFNKPSAANTDRSGTLDFKRWSTRYPFGNWRVNTAGDDDMWNVNTTGLNPGIGWVDGNYYPNMELFMQELGYIDGNSDPQFDIFSNSSDGLVIQAHENPWKNPINRRQDYLAGMISSHSEPDTGNPHGFEFTYGYIEARARLPRGANGFRAALWLYSDNSFYNEIYDRPPVYEMDFMEFLPNTRDVDPDTGEECFIVQTDVFGLADNSDIVTYDTIFNTYHFPDGRTPVNWTFNSDDVYAPERCALDNSGSPIDFGTRNDGWATYGLLWQPGSIEWYIDGVLINRVDQELGNTCYDQLQPNTKECGTAIYDSRMYIIASMHMGNPYFEGSVDTRAFTENGGPEFEIDYIRVYQDTSEESVHTWCGMGHSDARDCSTR